MANPGRKFLKVDGMWCCVDCRAPISATTRYLRCVDCVGNYCRPRAAVRDRAMALVQLEIRHGRLPRARTLKCVDCAKQAREYDHRDYRKPIDVVPVCHSCNLKRGPGAGLPG